ncbi:hypothetical protein [Brevibacillus nitrificans]|nr:hypothetical protein [Brevibacillus nitrificans]MDR7316903.1 hypothetical protein [Brevibacillus nitrificans]
MDIKQLRYFIAIAEEKKISAAAKKRNRGGSAREIKYRGQHAFFRPISI